MNTEQQIENRPTEPQPGFADLRAIGGETVWLKAIDGGVLGGALEIFATDSDRSERGKSMLFTVADLDAVQRVLDVAKSAQGHEGGNEMTPDEIARARELAKLCLSLEAEGKANVTEATFARYALRALESLEASRRECEELRAEVEGLKASCYVAPEAKGVVTLVIDLSLYDQTLIEPGVSICADVWFDGAGMVHALSGEVLSVDLGATP